ncbi:hypothetical protein QP158_11310, partial [Streptococcus agalactiae]|nr:hypothetical protein [Streptococcus agalactiae]
MGRFQRAEAAGLIACLACAIFSIVVMSVYMKTMPAIWQVTQRLFTVASGIVAICSMCTFVVGYLRTHKEILKKNWLQIAKHAFEIIALS